jgi:hypothetical protein
MSPACPWFARAGRAWGGRGPCYPCEADCVFWGKGSRGISALKADDRSARAHYPNRPLAQPVNLTAIDSNRGLSVGEQTLEETNVV